MEVEMATKITAALEDDLDGGPAVETVRFAVGGAEYEIDLNKKKNAAVFRRQLAPFVEHARRAGRGAAPPGWAVGGGPRARCGDPGVGEPAGNRC
jgi:Lsr2